MRILVVGSSHEAAMEHHYLRYLGEMGIENELFSAQNVFYDYYQASLLNKIKFRLGISGVFPKINRELIQKTESYKPDVLLVFKGMEIFPSTLKTLKQKGVKLANYNPDNPFIFSGYGSGNKNVSSSTGLYDLYCTYDPFVVKKLEEQGTKAALIPFGFEISEKEFEECKKQEEVLRICFLGNPDKARAAFVDQLASAGVPVDVYGNYWNRYKLAKNIRTFDAVFGLEFWKVLHRYRVQLNLMRPHNLESHNMRSIEVPAVGAIGLFPKTPDHSRFFEEGKEIFLYEDLTDCIQQAQKILSMTEEKANKIRTQARERALRSGYSYKERTRQLVQYLETIL